jgi:hypothetical protein
MLDRLIFDTTDAQTIADSHSVGAYLRDANGDLITSQANGSQQALDVGINVAGVQIDPRQIRALTNADVVTAEQGTSPWVVSATDLDIRDLNHAQDNVAIAQGGNTMVVNADGSINVNADISVVTGSDKAEDSAHASGDIGSYVLAVRQDTLAASTSTDGDYASLKVSAAGALYVNLAESTATITTSDAALANTAILSTANALDVADTAEAVKASALASRKYLWIYNNDNTKVFVGASGVTAANGFPVSPGSYLELRAGPAVSPFFVGQSGKTPEVRTLELS